MGDAWVVLVVAGVVEAAWSQSIKPTENFTRLWPTLLCLALGVASVYLLSRAMRELPVGAAYAVFTGIGSVGAVGLGIILYGDPLSVGRLAAIGLIVAGVMAAQASGSA